ncbi:MAG: S8 family serine peptidase, partial [Oscillospiraceae bacterium]|nr:S8 family serine peptidase [Oscillospiraceae bacterium]
PKESDNAEGIEDVVLLHLRRKDRRAVMAAVSRLMTHPDVVYAEPDYLEEAHLIPNDPLVRYLWGMETIQAPLAWDYATGSPHVIVGVLDSGVDMNHPDLMSNLVAGRAFDLMDETGHGTHVAGTIGAVGNNRIGVAGVCWNVGLANFKIGNRVFDLAAAIAAIDYAALNRIPILNNSWGGRGYSATLRFAIKQYGGLFIASAGNDGTNNDFAPMFPASYDNENIISVAASTPYNTLASFSNYGAGSVDIAAPGTGILSAALNGGYSYLNGTSMAAPHVAGAAALLKSYRPGLTVPEIKEIILSSAEKHLNLSGRVAAGGVLNVNAMMELARDA